MVSPKGNVVSFSREDQSHPIDSTSGAAGLINLVKSSTSEHLNTFMQKMFDNVDDFLFDLADKAGSNVEQTLYFDAMREIRLKKEPIIKIFNKEFATLYAKSLKKQAKPHENVSITFSSLDNLLLMEDDELEESLAITNMIAKAHNLSRDTLFALEQRLGQIIYTTEISSDNNPIGPANICNAFRQAVEVIDSEIKIKLIVYKLFDRFVVQYLSSLYDDINKKLIEAGVLPQIKLKVRKQPNAAAQQPGVIATDGKAPAMDNGYAAQEGYGLPGYPPMQGAPMQGNSMYAAAPGQMMGGYRGVSNSDDEVFASMQNLLYVQRTGMVGGGQYPGGGSIYSPAVRAAYDNLGAHDQYYGTQDVISALSSLQQSPSVPVFSNVAGNIGPQIRNTLVDTIGKERGDKQPKSINRTDDDTIDIVSMMFDFILEDRNLPDAMKVLLGRLQIPLVKLAIIDKSFFSNKSHPARRLLNELASAGLDWAENEENINDPIYKKVEHVVERVIAEFEKNTNIFAELLGEFVYFKQREQQRVEEDKRKLETAKVRVASEIEARVIYEIPELIRRVLTGPWKEVLTAIFQKEGGESKAWHAALRVADDLIWSVQPKLSTDERHNLVRVIPKVLRGLQTGLTFIAFDKTKMEKLFKELEEYHLTCLRGGTAQTIQKKAKTKNKNKFSNMIDKLRDEPESLDDDKFQEEYHIHSDESQTNEQSQDEQDVEEIVMETPILEEAVDVDTDWYEENANVVKALELGVWVEFKDDKEQVSRGKLAWKSDFLGEYTFVNRKYKVIADKTERDLAFDFFQGNARIIENIPLIDRAMDAVLSGLKKVTTKNEPTTVTP